MCGENFYRFFGRRWEDGSSPRVRGKQVCTCHCGATLRLIPACAGKTGLSSLIDAQTRAHPRVCGENLDYKDPANWWKGSSPRVRGKRVHKLISRHACGLIPACAGKTVAHSLINAVLGAHPRVCGENLTTLIT